MQTRRGVNSSGVLGCSFKAGNRARIPALVAVLALLLSLLVLEGQAQTATAFSSLYAFTAFSIDMNGNLDGALPTAGLIQGSDGNFYGTASEGGQVDSNLAEGTIFKITPGGAFTTLFYFFGDRDGAEPCASLIQARDGNFYGTSSLGGGPMGDGGGTVFQMTAAGVLETLYVFSPLDRNNVNADGACPTCSLIQDDDGNFYGTTQKGGANGSGTVFKLTPAGVLTVLHTFGATDASHANVDGARPATGLTKGSDGNFYGTTFYGGPGGYGTVFQITPASAFTTLTSFDLSNGEHSVAALIQGSGGNFYGTTIGGGANGKGTIFQITSAGALTTQHSFSGSDGANPWAALTLGSDGNFYGTTFQGGMNDTGTVFQVSSAGAFTTLHSFDAPYSGDENFTLANNGGLYPYAPLVQGGDGNFYGTASGGGNGGTGAIFRIAPAGVLAITSPAAATVLVGHAFNYQISTSGSPTNLTVGTLPTGLSYDAASGVISGVPPMLGSFHISLSASNAGGTVSSTLVLSVVDYPVATLRADAPSVKIGSGGIRQFYVSLSAAQTSNVVVHYAIKGTAMNGTDYVLIKGTKRFTTGETFRAINIRPRSDLSGVSQKTVKLLLKPGTGYTVGTAASAKVKLVQ